jgi:hypothetical protein
MEDVFMKFGMIIVGVAVISFMIVFAFQSFNRQQLTPEERDQEIIGDSVAVGARIGKLCERCLSDNVNRDCYFLSIDLTEGEVTQDIFVSKIKLNNDLVAGKHNVRLSNVDGLCEVVKIG